MMSTIRVSSSLLPESRDCRGVALQMLHAFILQKSRKNTELLRNDILPGSDIQDPKLDSANKHETQKGPACRLLSV